MPSGILAIWSDIDAAGEDDYNAWYDREHLFERLTIPGFHLIGEPDRPRR